MDCKWCKNKQILRRKGVENFFFLMISYIFTHLSNDQLTYTHPILLPDVPCHSQAVERTIKDVSAASCKVYGRKSRHGMVLQSKKSRLEIPKIGSKKDFINS